MRKDTLSECAELETVEFQDEHIIVGGQSRSTHSWFRYYDEILSFCRPRLLLLTISFVTLVVLVANLSSKKEETPTAYNAPHLLEGRLHCSRNNPDPAGKPYERRIDRSYCENDFDTVQWHFMEDIRNSEILRCYNLTHRYCVPDIDTDFPTLNDVDKTEYITPEFPGCAHEFFEYDDGSLYSRSGSLMPESFNAKCEDVLLWRLIYFVSPETGCGDDVPLRFCNCNGTLNMDFLTGDGPFNCQEFEIADLYKQGSEDDYGLEEDCKRERQKRCP